MRVVNLACVFLRWEYLHQLIHLLIRIRINSYFSGEFAGLLYIRLLIFNLPNAAVSILAKHDVVIGSAAALSMPLILTSTGALKLM